MTVHPLPGTSNFSNTESFDMMKTMLMGAMIAFALVETPALANNRGEFCAGFEEGYKMVKGEIALVPVCPVEPVTPINSTPFREGIKAGMETAWSRG